MDTRLVYYGRRRTLVKRAICTMRRWPKVIVLLSLMFPLLAASTHALQPSEVVVVANRFVPGSVKLARYYMEQRGIPKGNLVRITTTEKESCSRAIYDKEIAAPVRAFLQRDEHAGKIRALVTMRGMPLRVAAPLLTRDERRQLEQLKQERETLRQISESESSDEDDKATKQQLARLEGLIKAFDRADYSAAVDSELSLVLVEDYDLKFWQPNPFFVGFQKQQLAISKDEVLLVSRLDAPSDELVRRMIDDSLAAEAAGIEGVAYFDARWEPTTKQKVQGSALYDQSLHRAAERVRARDILPVVVEQTSALLQPGEAPGTALYGGWYSLARYVPAFEWVPGSVGMHIASQECQTLRGGGQYWCKRMLEEGAAAVIGPVGEPYLQSFPLPEVFFGYLTDGYYSLAEAYILSLPYLSWRMVLVGDPLYRPFSVYQEKVARPGS